MRRALVTGVVASGILAGIALAAEPSPSVDIELEPVIVIAEQPGPGLLKVTRGDNVLWILPRHDPLQAGMTWRTQQIEARIAGSKEVLLPPDVQVEPSVGVLKLLALIPAIPAALKATKNPGGAKLEKVLPPATHARWLALRNRYFVSYSKKAKVEEVEQWRPLVALSMLRGWAQAKSGLSRGSVDSLVQRVATTHKVPVRRLPAIRRAVKLEKNIRGMLKQAVAQPHAEVECFEQGLDALEPDLELARERAKAWAAGDIARLRDLHRDYRPTDDCAFKTMMALTERDSKDAARARKMLESFFWHEEQGYVQAQRDWMAAAQKALEVNPSTFAVLSVGDLYRAGGYLDTLRGLGYTVEGPV